MRSGSEAALKAARDRWSGLLHQRGSGERELAQALFAIVDILHANPTLTAALEDNARDPQDRATLVRNVLGGKVADEVTELVMGVARDRWSEQGDLVTGLESLGVFTLLSGAQREGKLSDVEGQLYTAMRTLRTERKLRLALGDSAYDVAARQKLVNDVFSDMDEHTRDLLSRAIVRNERGTTLAQSLTGYMDDAAQQGNHIAASVTSAIPLTDEQIERLSSILSRTYNTDVSVHVSIDPAVIGGIRIHVGDDVIDGTLASRLGAVREAFNN